MGTRKKLCAAYDDLDHFASIQFHSVACLHVYGRFLESFLVAQYDLLVRFDLACRSDARHSDNWPALTIRYLGGGGGGLEFLLLANFFFYLREKTIFFFGDQRPTIFFYVTSKIFFCRILSLIMYITIWCFFWSTYFSSISITNFFFCPYFQQTFFF